MTTLGFHVAGVPVRLRVEGSVVAESLRDLYARRAPVTLPHRRELRVEIHGGVLRMEHEGLAGTADLETAVVDAPPSWYVADALVRAAVCWRLAQEDAFLLHAAAVRRDGRAIVLLGRSGAGKSTAARALGGALSDEFCVLARRGGGWEARGTPWWVGSGGRAPLARLVWLVRGEPPSVRPARGADLVRAIAREAVRGLPGDAFRRRVFELFADLAREGALRVAAPEGRLVEALREALA